MLKYHITAAFSFFPKINCGQREGGVTNNSFKYQEHSYRTANNFQTISRKDHSYRQVMRRKN